MPPGPPAESNPNQLDGAIGSTRKVGGQPAAGCKSLAQNRCIRQVDMATMEASFVARPGMFDHAAFIAAILADPEDDLRRLIYADWLDERGDVRGDFIRSQIAEARGESTAAQSRALEAEFGRKWAG